MLQAQGGQSLAGVTAAPSIPSRLCRAAPSHCPVLKAGQPERGVFLAGDTGGAASGYLFFFSLIGELWNSTMSHLALSGTRLQAPSGFPVQLPWPSEK